MNLIGTDKPVRATKARLEANDCPPNCKRDHCDECPFRLKPESKSKNN